MNFSKAFEQPLSHRWMSICHSKCRLGDLLPHLVELCKQSLNLTQKAFGRLQEFLPWNIRLLNEPRRVCLYFFGFQGNHWTTFQNG